MRQIISAQDSVLSKELLTSSLLQNLWLEIFKNTDISYQEEHKEHSTASQARLQLMMQFIHLNYSRSISLDDIAKQAMVSKSTALNLFRKYLHITPVNYLINYRLKQAGQLQIIQKTLPINPNGIPETKALSVNLFPFGYFASKKQNRCNFHPIRGRKLQRFNYLESVD